MAKRVSVLDTDDLSLWYYPDNKIIHHQFHRFTYGAKLRDGLSKGCEVIEEYSARKWLSDDRKNAALKPEDKDWCEKVWFPRVARAGWRYWAIVLPEKVTGQMNMKRIVTSCAEEGITTRIFNEPKAAMFWLIKVESSDSP